MTIRLFPADRRIDRHMDHMDALRHQFPGHALGQARLAVGGCGKRATARITFQGSAGVGKHDRAFVPIPAGFDIWSGGAASTMTTFCSG